MRNASLGVFLVSAMLFSCQQETPTTNAPVPVAPPSSVVKPATLDPSPAKLQSIIARMDKDTADDEVNAIYEYGLDPEVRERLLDTALQSLETIPARAKAHLLRALQLLALKTPLRGEKIRSAIGAQLKDPDRWVVVKAADALAALHDKEVIPLLVGAMSHKDPEVVEAARQGLTYMTAQQLKGSADWKRWWDKNKDSFQLPPHPAGK